MSISQFLAKRVEHLPETNGGVGVVSGGVVEIKNEYERLKNAKQHINATVNTETRLGVWNTLLPHVYKANDSVFYRDMDGNHDAKVIKVHTDDRTPYYKIGTAGGERETVGDRLSLVPTGSAPSTH